MPEGESWQPGFEHRSVRTARGKQTGQGSSQPDRQTEKLQANCRSEERTSLQLQEGGAGEWRQAHGLEKGVLSLLFTGLPRGMMPLEQPVVAAPWDALPPTQPPSAPRVPGCSKSPASFPLAPLSRPSLRPHTPASLKLCAFCTLASRLLLILGPPGNP